MDKSTVKFGQPASDTAAQSQYGNPGGGSGAPSSETPGRTQGNPQPNQGTPGLVAVTVPGGEQPEGKRGPGRPRKDGAVPQPKAAKPQNGAVKHDAGLEINITAFIKTAFDITSLKAGPIWALSQEEARAIAVPAASILERAGAGAVTSKYSDYFMLIFAVAGVLVPRVIAAQTTRPTENKSMEVLKHGPKLQPVPQRQTNDANKPANGNSPTISENPISESMPGLAI